MCKVPVFKAEEVVTILIKIGFREVRQRGSHKQFRHNDSRGTAVPFLSGRGSLGDLAPANL
jgi:predicted RNA binding protein YcfA (HicA-like mRNA interferase family)